MLELKDINYTVTEESGEQKTIIDGLNLEIEDGRFVVITGPNDSPSSAKYSSTPGSGDKVQVNARLGGATSRTNVRASAYEF